METAPDHAGSTPLQEIVGIHTEMRPGEGSEAEMGDLRWRGAVIGRSLSRVRECDGGRRQTLPCAVSPFQPVPRWCRVASGVVRSPRRVTILDVAERAGVHAATVSRTINTPERVAPATRRRVEKAVRDLGFVPNRAARGLITGRTGNIAVIVPDITNPHFASLVRSVERSAREVDLQVLLVDTGEHPDEEVRAARTMFRDVDGFVVASPRRLHRQLDAFDAKPVVFVNRPVRRACLHSVPDGSCGRRRAAPSGGARAPQAGLPGRSPGLVGRRRAPGRRAAHQPRHRHARRRAHGGRAHLRGGRRSRPGDHRQHGHRRHGLQRPDGARRHRRLDRSGTSVPATSALSASTTCRWPPWSHPRSPPSGCRHARPGRLP